VSVTGSSVKGTWYTISKYRSWFAIHLGFGYNTDIFKTNAQLISDATDNSVSLEWTVTGKDVDKYEVSYEVAGSAYPFQNKTTTTDKKITSKKSTYKYKLQLTHAHICTHIVIVYSWWTSTGYEIQV